MGDIVLVEIPNNIGHQQGGIRPCVIVSNNIGNEISPMIKVLPITTKRRKSTQPTHVHFNKDEVDGLLMDSTVEAESTWVVNKWQVKKTLGQFTDEQLDRIACAMVYADPIVARAFNMGILDEATFAHICQH
jgi:Growth inhibitor